LLYLSILAAKLFLRCIIISKKSARIAYRFGLYLDGQLVLQVEFIDLAHKLRCPTIFEDYLNKRF
jgi:hypothetical protein